MPSNHSIHDQKVDLEAQKPEIQSTISETTLHEASPVLFTKQPSPQQVANQSTRKNPFKIRIKIDSKIIYDAILGLSDGLTVPFALTAGLSSLGTTRIVILGGLAELVAGAISMGLGGFIGAKSEYEAYQASCRKVNDLIQSSPSTVQAILKSHFSTYNLSSVDQQAIINSFLSSSSTSSSDSLRDFLVTHHFETPCPDTSRPYVSAVTLGLSYFLGGFLALIPYFCVETHDVLTALWWSIGVMGIVMLVFGYCKTCVVRGWKGKANVLAGIKGAVQMLVIGALAVGAAVGLVKAIQAGTGSWQTTT